MGKTITQCDLCRNQFNLDTNDGHKPDCKASTQTFMESVQPLRIFKVTSDTHALSGTVIVAAPTKDDAETMVIEEYFYRLLDDDLADAFEIEEVTEPEIFDVDAQSETFKEKYERVRQK